MNFQLGANFSAEGNPRTAYTGLAVSLGVLALLYYRPIFALIQLGRANDLYSHLFLVPLISAYLVWTQKDRRVKAAPAGSGKWACGPALLGLIMIGGLFFATDRGWRPTLQDEVFLLNASLLLFALASAFLFLGPRLLWPFAFPLCLLLFALPIPTWVESAIELFFQHASADVASVLFGMADTPAVRSGLKFHLPGIIMEVAQECSGIRSSLVLFITSLVGGYLFLNRPGHRVVLALSVIPVAILRNGIRIFTIGILCASLGPEMIDSWIHRSGGPLFFGLSLLPFGALLLILRRTELRRAR